MGYLCGNEWKQPITTKNSTGIEKYPQYWYSLKYGYGFMKFRNQRLDSLLIKICLRLFENISDLNDTEWINQHNDQVVIETVVRSLINRFGVEQKVVVFTHSTKVLNLSAFYWIDTKYHCG